MIRNTALQALLLESPPIQFEYLEKLISVFSENAFLHSAYVRGSIARNDFDRASDIDLAIAFDSRGFEDAVESLNDLMKEHFNILFPGWLDRIVPNFGGLGFVYLADTPGKFLQIDLYLLPSHRLDSLLKLPGLKKVYERSQASDSTNHSDDEQTTRIIQEKLAAAQTTSSLLVEIFILAHLIQKRILRGQVFLNHSESAMIHRAFRDLIRLVLDTAYRDYGWYHLQENSKKSPELERWTEVLKNFVTTAAIHDASSICQLLSVVHEFSNRNAPDAQIGIADSISHFHNMFPKRMP